MKKKKLFYTNHYEAPLSAEIYQSYKKLLDHISQLPIDIYTEKSIDSTGGKVSISDILAYQIGWGKLLINWYETGLTGKIPDMPGEGFVSWDYRGLAQHFYTKYQYNSASEQQ